MSLDIESHVGSIFLFKLDLYKIDCEIYTKSLLLNFLMALFVLNCVELRKSKKLSLY